MNTRKQKILIVDDSEINRSILADMLGDEFEIIEACDGLQAINYMRSNSVDLSLVLLDIVMPKMDGLEVLAMMNSYKWILDIPVIMISSESSASYIGRAYELGATDYIQRPFDTAVVHRRAMNAIMLYAKQKKLIGLVEEQIYEKGKEQSLMINILSYVVEIRNGESGLHVLHIYTMTEILLQSLLKFTDKYNLTPQDISLITMASALHDIGKIAVDEKLLSKPENTLTAAEFDMVKSHTTHGAEMLEKVPFRKNEPLLRVAKEICRSHHERFDGKGYPDGLAGDDIPISAQAVALADAYDELTGKSGIPHDKAMDMLERGACGAFNPLLIKAMRFASGKIQADLRVSSMSGTRRDVERITREVLSHSELTVSQRTLDLLEREREKYRFITSGLKEVLFEVYGDPSAITFLEGGAQRLGVDATLDNPENNAALAKCFGGDNVKKLFKLIREATPEKPTVGLECNINLDGKQCPVKILALAHYTQGGGAGDYVFDSAIGKIENKA